MRIAVSSKDGTRECTTIEKDLIRIGRAQDNDIVLTGMKVSRYHAEIRRKNSEFIIADRDSTNNVFIGTKKVEKEEKLRTGETFRIADFKLELIEEPVKEESLQELKRKVHEELLERMDLKNLNFDEMREKELWKKTRKVIENIINEKNLTFSSITVSDFVKEILDETLGLGPLETLIDDPEITEIMVNGKDHVYIERHGKLFLYPRTFTSDEQVLAVIERIVTPLGRRIDESTPLVDARLKDGSRVNAIIPPLSMTGPVLTIRKFSPNLLGMEQLIHLGSLTETIAEFLRICVIAKQNILISGGTGTGKTTLLNIISKFVPDNERIITIEDSAELKLSQEHVVGLEARPPNIEGRGEVTIRDLLRNALRMRPDRIIVGECRGGEALDMLQAMNTGHDGSITTIHANSCRDSLSRLETMVLMAGMDLPVRAIREQIASAIQIILQLDRFPDGERKVTSASEVTGMDRESIHLQDIFVLEEKADSAGTFKATGIIPEFIKKLQKQGKNVNLKIFT